MGLFGDVDATQVSDNPFYVGPGTYEAVVSEATLWVDEEEIKNPAIFISWTIDDESEYSGNSVSDRLAVFPDISEEDITPQIRKQFSFTKSRLKQMGLDEDQMNVLLDDENLEDLVGLEATIAVKVTKDKNDPEKLYSNVTKVVIAE